jgi:hypothetical protein
MNPSTIFSKTGKGVQEATGKTSNLSRADRAVLAAIDGKSTLGEVQAKFEKIPEGKFAVLITQLDKDGYIREASGGSLQAAPVKPVAAPAQPTGPGKPATTSVPPGKPTPESAPPVEGDELDFTQAIKIPSRTQQVDLAAAARAEAERKAKEQQMMDYRMRQEAEARAKAEADAKVKAARDAAVRAATEAKAKADAEAKAKTEAAERERRAAEERARKEAEEKTALAARLEQERKAREDAERRAREVEQRAKREADEKAKREAEEKAKREAEDKTRRETEEKAKREAEAKAKREADEKAKRESEDRTKREAEDRTKREAEEKARRESDEKAKREAEEKAQRAAEEKARRERQEQEQRAREEEDRRRREESGSKRREEEERRRKDEDEQRAKDEAERKAREERDRKARDEAEAKAKATAEAAGAEAFLADLAAFSVREEEERKAREEQERKSRESARARAKEAERQRKSGEEEAQRRRDEERRQKELAEQRAREEEERRQREIEEEARSQAEERKRKARESLAAKELEQRLQGPAEGDDVVVGPEEIDMGEVEQDRKALDKAARKREKERERERKREEELERERQREEERLAREKATQALRRRKPIAWGKILGTGLVLALVGGLAVVHLMPLQTADYERAASQALGVPVKIASGRMSVLTGAQVHLERVSIGDLRIAEVRGSTDFGSLFGEPKTFTRVELEGVALQQARLAELLLGKMRPNQLRIERIALKRARFDGPVALPLLDVEAVLAGDGSIRSLKATGPDKLELDLTPRNGQIAFEVNAGSLTVPFVPGLNLVDFGAKGSADRQGMTVTSFDGRAYEGVIAGTANIRWGETWTVDGNLRIRGINAAVFAPTLVSEGKAEGRGSYSMGGPDLAKLGQGARLEGVIKIERGVLGAFDLARAIQTGGSQTAGRTLFAELNAQGLFDKGTVQLRNITIAAGALNAGASLDVGPDGALAGRVAAEVKTASQTLRTTLNISGVLKEPVVRR